METITPSLWAGFKFIQRIKKRKGLFLYARLFSYTAHSKVIPSSISVVVNMWSN
jgi:hypothetical protein